VPGRPLEQTGGPRPDYRSLAHVSRVGNYCALSILTQRRTGGGRSEPYRLQVLDRRQSFTDISAKLGRGWSAAMT
jgi:hypothetical protein